MRVVFDICAGILSLLLSIRCGVIAAQIFEDSDSKIGSGFSLILLVGSVGIFIVSGFYFTVPFMN